ncbi:hypothetical protein, partial [Paenibacillus sonchi]
ATWHELADKHMEDIGELEMKLLEAEEKSSALQTEIDTLRGQADGMVQQLDRESGLRAEAEAESRQHQAEAEAARKELAALRGRYEELIAQYDEVLQDGEQLKERYELLEAEGEETARRLEELYETGREAAAAAAE